MPFVTSTHHVNLLDGIRKFYGNADGTINGHRLVSIDSLGDYIEAPANDLNVIGVHLEGQQRLDHAPIVLATGAVPLVAAQAIEAGRLLKSYYGGRVGVMVTAARVGQDILVATAGGGFGNQPTNDGIEIVSDNNVVDIGQTLTCYGTTNGGDVVVSEVLTLNGTTQVASVKVNWGEMLGFELSAALTGTLTIREASGNATIITIAAGTLRAGITNVSAANVRALAQAPTAVGDNATTKKVGLVGTGTDGAALMQSKALNGATAITFPTKMNTVSKVLLGDVEAGRTAAIDVGAEDDEHLKIGKSLTSATGLGSEIWVLLLP